MNLMLVKGKRANFDVLYQTPTDVSYKAIESDNPLDVYIEWLRAMNCYEQYHVDEIKEYLDDGWTFEII